MEHIKPTLHSHTLCQVTPANAQTKTWQRVCLFQRTTNRQSERYKNTERTTACKQYYLAAGETQGNIAYTQTVIGHFKRPNNPVIKESTFKSFCFK